MVIPPVPRGIELLAKRAQANPEFKERLLEQRSAAAEEAGIPLTEAEKAMLDDATVEQLEQTLTTAGKTITPGEWYLKGSITNDMFSCTTGH